MHPSLSDKKASEVFIDNGDEMNDSLNLYSTPGLTTLSSPGLTFGGGGLTDYSTTPSPTYNNDGGGYNTTTPTYTTPTIDQKAINEYDQAIANTQAGFGRLDNQLQSGYSGIDASYQNALNQLLQSKNQGEQSYNKATQDTKTNYVGAKNTIGSQAGEALNGLLRLLGSRGAGGSLAATGTGTGTARGSVSRAATLQRSDVGNAFAQNLQGLDQNWGQFLQNYNNQTASAGSQKDTARQSLQSNVDTNRASLLQTLAQLQAQRAEAAGGNSVTAAQPYLDQANSILDRASKYTVAPINYQTGAYQAPELAAYQPKAQPTATFDGSAPNDYFSPYLATLLGKKQQTGIV